MCVDMCADMCIDMCVSSRCSSPCMGTLPSRRSSTTCLWTPWLDSSSHDVFRHLLRHGQHCMHTSLHTCLCTCLANAVVCWVAHVHTHVQTHVHTHFVCALPAHKSTCMVHTQGESTSRRWLIRSLFRTHVYAHVHTHVYTHFYQLRRKAFNTCQSCELLLLQG